MRSDRIVLGLSLAVTPFASVAQSPWTGDEVRALVQEMMADAAKRSSLIDSPSVAGHDGRFFLTSQDGDFRLQVGGELQFRYYGNFDADSGADDGFEGGFQTQRTRLEFRGHVIDPKLTYRFLTNFNRDTGSLELQDAWGEYEVSGGFLVRWGQFKLPFDREFFGTSATTTQTIERSLASSIFRLDRSQGVQLTYQAERWRAFGAVSDGRRAPNTGYTNPVEADIALSGRAELRLGDAGWRQFRDQTSFRGDKFGALLGLGGHWQQEGSTGAPAGANGTVDLFQYTGDIGIEGDGWNVLGAVVGRTFEDSANSISDLSLVVQGGIFLSDNVELYGRYTHIFPDGDRAGGDDDFAAITGGFHWYVMPRSHAVKLSAEITFYPDSQADSASIVRAPDTSVGLRPDNDGGQFGIIVQVQLVF